MSIAVATLQLAACSLLVSPDDYVGTRPLDSLWAYYRFDGDTVDSSGSAHDGILAGATATLDGSGVIGTALTCVNAGDKVKISDDFAPGTSSFTLAMFYRIEMTGGGIAAHSLNTFIVKGSAFEDSTNDQPGFGIGYNDTTQNVAGFIRDNVSAHAWVSTHAAASSELPLRDGRFHHTALVVDRDTARVSLYVDGTLHDFTGIPIGYGSVDATAIAQLCSEGTVNNPSIQMDGALDEVMIFTRALTPAEVAGLAARTHD